MASDSTATIPKLFVQTATQVLFAKIEAPPHAQYLGDAPLVSTAQMEQQRKCVLQEHMVTLLVLLIVPVGVHHVQLGFTVQQPLLDIHLLD